MVATTGFEWKETGWYVEPKTARDVMTLLAAIGSYSVGQQFAWRGMPSNDFSLSSSLQRTLGHRATEDDLRAAEEDLLRRARAWGLGLQPTGYVDDLQLLADLQHYGIPTRLIDFTSNPTTALWFACQPAGTHVSKTGVLLALNTTNWPAHQTIGSPDTFDYARQDDPTGARLKQALASNTPFRVESAFPNERLRAQEGFFVSGPLPPPPPQEKIGEVMVSIERITPFHAINLDYAPGDAPQLEADLSGPRLRGAPRAVPFVAVGIRSQLKSQLLRSLEGTYNRHARVLFPDFAGFRELDRPGSTPRRTETPQTNHD
jgi:hypothetical protein